MSRGRGLPALEELTMDRDSEKTTVAGRMTPPIGPLAWYWVGTPHGGYSACGTWQQAFSAREAEALAVNGYFATLLRPEVAARRAAGNGEGWSVQTRAERVGPTPLESGIATDALIALGFDIQDASARSRIYEQMLTEANTAIACVQPEWCRRPTPESRARHDW